MKPEHDHLNDSLNDDQPLPDTDLRDLVSEEDLVEVTREELERFDDSTFDTSQVEVPPDLADPRHILRLLDEEASVSEPILPLHTRDAARQVALPSLAAGQPRSDRHETFDFRVTPDRFRELAPLVARAYMDVRTHWSTDFVVAEPDFNLPFLQRCWELGAAAAAEELNWTLLNARKDGRLHGLPRARAFSIPRKRLDLFSFASEIALRHIQDLAYFQEQREVSLDKLLCNPRLAAEFDALARGLAPGFTSLEYRWAAITLRKARRPAKGVTRLTLQDLGCADAIRPSRIPRTPGLFWATYDDRSAFVGVAEDLRLQIERFLVALGPRVAPRWADDGDRGVARLYALDMPGTNPSIRETQRSALLKYAGSRWNFLNGSLFNAAA